MKDVSKDVWHIAQESERGYWDIKRYEPARLIYAIYDKYSLLMQIETNYPQIIKEPPNTGKALEIGIGPLGFGMVSLLEPSEKWEITGIDPLPRMQLPELPNYLKSFLNELYNRTKTYVQTPAEEFNSPTNSFDLIICDNVLEHTFNPHKIIKNTYDLLTPGGYLVIRESTLSHYSKWRKKIFSKKYHDSAHTISFTYQELIDTIKHKGYSINYMQKDRFEIRKRICGKARRRILFCKKPA